MSAWIVGVLTRLRGEGSPTGLYAVGTRVVAAAVSFVGGILILALFDPGRIGVFLSFTSLAGFSAVADLGLTYSLLLAVSSRPANEAPAVAWAAFAAAVPTVLATSVVMFIGGSFFLMGGDVERARWLWPWIAFCAVSSAQLVLTLGLTYVEGTGGRHAAWKANFWIEVAAGVAFIAAVAAQVELWAVAASAVVRVVLIVLLFVWCFDLPARVGGFSRFALWRDQLWPMQWKTLVNTLVGVSTTRLLTPLLLVAQGSVVAGQTGLVLALGYLVTTASSVWPLSQTALYAGYYHRGEYREFKSIIRQTFLASSVLSVLLVIGGGVVCELLKAGSAHMAARLPDSVVLWIILAAAPIGHLSNCLAMAVRAQRRDPVVIPNLLLAVPALIALFLSADRGALAFAVAYLVTGVMFMSLYGYFFFRSMRVIQHAS